MTDPPKSLLLKSPKNPVKTKEKSVDKKLRATVMDLVRRRFHQKHRENHKKGKTYDR
jgi:hypothetical protein